VKGDYEKSDYEKSDYEKKFGRLLAKIWLEPAFSDELMSDPKSTLRNNGIDVPDGVEVKFVEVPSIEVPALNDLYLKRLDRFISTDWTVSEGDLVLALPARPSSTRISDEELARVVGGDARLDIDWKCHFTGRCIW
jgi:hypothetical protein